MPLVVGYTWDGSRRSGLVAVCGITLTVSVVSAMSDIGGANDH